ncbi:MAG: D-sedoheptulose 7-phosphate isomerase [Chloroflexi bacterium]|nr:D-sedoheptulose 7-phosphate isomerase [Chloroflexota bacterium]
MRKRVETELRETTQLYHTMAAEMADDLVQATDMVLDTLQGGGKVLVCGNGGSAATAEHIAGELVGRFRRERRGWPAIALAADGGVVTAVANDYGFEQVFARQVQALAGPGDLLIGMSTSGESLNVVLALKEARAKGARTLAMTGQRGGPLADAADCALRVPSDDVPRVQEAHLVIGHIVCGLVEEALAGETSAWEASAVGSIIRSLSEDTP